MLAQVTPAMTSRWILKLSTTKNCDKLSLSSCGYKEGEMDEGLFGSCAAIPVEDGGVTIGDGSVCRYAIESDDPEGVVVSD